MTAIEYFYSAHSAYAYLGSARFMAIAAAAGRPIAHKPMDLRRVVAESGSVPFGQRTPAHRDYFFRREIERWSEQRGAPVMAGTPTTHGHDMTLVNCLLIAGIEQGLDIGPLAHRFLESHWRDDADLADARTLAGLAAAVGTDAAPLIAAAETEPVRAAYRANTEEAIRRSVFGSPTYIVNGDMFYGQDRLEMVKRALQTPYKGRPVKP